MINKYVIFIGLAIIEQIIMVILTKGIVHLQYEYISIKYSEFKFADRTNRPYGLNIIIRIFVPLIYTVILAGIFYDTGNSYLVQDIYWISIFYYLIRWFNIIFILNRTELNDWKNDAITCFIGILLNFILYEAFITKTDRIFLTIDEWRDGIWIGIITFFFVLIRDYMYNHIYVNSEQSFSRKEKYILRKYEYFYNKYGDIIKEDDKLLESIVYGIMIYENYNRPFFYRIFEYIKCIVMGQATLGVMQVKSRGLISDRTSVKKGYKIIKNAYKKYSESDSEEDLIRQTISEYNGGESYQDEVIYIIMIIEDNIE